MSVFVSVCVNKCLCSMCVCVFMQAIVESGGGRWLTAAQFKQELKAPAASSTSSSSFSSSAAGMHACIYVSSGVRDRNRRNQS